MKEPVIIDNSYVRKPRLIFRGEFKKVFKQLKSGTSECKCGKVISANKSQCLKCSIEVKENGTES